MHSILSNTTSKLVTIKNRKLFHSSVINCVKILGIETSCDDTGCAIVDDRGKVIGESLESQLSIHVENGGILPPLARDLHKENIEKVVNKALEKANIQFTDVDAIATTVKPGLALSLLVGMEYGKMLAKKANKPFIPIHHMEAHALTIRMTKKVDFPFVVLLLSGGHSILAVAKNINQFQLLGQTLDDAPGEALDKIARRLKLNNSSRWQGMSGGEAIGKAAQEGGNPIAFPVAEPLLRERDCNFSFAGIKNSTRSFILEEEEVHGVEGDVIIPTVADLCASVQFAMAKHICRRVQRAFEFLDLNKSIPEGNRYLVVSGGVAASSFFKEALSWVCSKCDYSLLVPPPHLCTDNGAMIAWNGVEKFLSGLDIFQPTDLDSIDIEPKCDFGENISNQVIAAGIKMTRIKYTDMIERTRKKDFAVG